MNPELAEQLVIMEMKLQSLLHDVRSLRNRHDFQQPRVNAAPSFFDALKGEDNHHPGVAKNG